MAQLFADKYNEFSIISSSMGIVGYADKYNEFSDINDSIGLGQYADKYSVFGGITQFISAPSGPTEDERRRSFLLFGGIEPRE